MKRVLLLNMDYFPRFGGVENSLRSLAQEYLQKGYTVHIVVANMLGEGGKELAEKEEVYDVEVYRFTRKHPLTFFYTGTKLIRELNKKYKYDLVISRSHSTTIMAKWARLSDVKYVVPGVMKTEVALNEKKINLKSKFRERYISYIQSLSFRLADQIYVFSENMYQSVVKINGDKKIKKCSPGCSAERFYTVTRENKNLLRIKNGLPVNARIALCIGRLENVKGFDIAIEAMKYTNDDIKLVIVGHGSQESKLKELVKLNGIEQKVIFFPATQTPEIFYQAADYFLLTSVYEPFGQVLLEASFCNLPVIAREPSGMVETATKEVYLNYSSLVKYFSEPKELASIINENSFELSKIEIELFKKQYSWGSLAGMLIGEKD